jgi:hypothetical protein
MSRINTAAERLAAALSGPGAIALGLAGLALSRGLLLLRPART